MQLPAAELLSDRVRLVEARLTLLQCLLLLKLLLALELLELLLLREPPLLLQLLTLKFKLLPLQL